MADQGMELGHHIRRNVIPAGMSVAAAAGLLGVGRPALSNLLNGHASLSGEMALRLEKAFDADAARLLEFQSEFRREQEVTAGKALGVRTYLPAFVGVKARDLSGWVRANIKARHELPVLIRRLVHSTGRGLREVDFPGFDSAEQHGWDGRVDAGEASAVDSRWKVWVGNRDEPGGQEKGGPRLQTSGEFDSRTGSYRVDVCIRDASPLGRQAPMGAGPRG